MDERVALISDVHGNDVAFEALLRDISQRGITRVINMGDIVGYGPEPERCIDLAMDFCNSNLCGNHEYAVLYDAEGFNSVARNAVDYVRELLQPVPGGEVGGDEDRLRRWQFLSALPCREEVNGCLVAHGSPRHEIMEYVLPSDPQLDPLKLDDIFECMTCPVAFVGHTHFPGIICEGEEDFLAAVEIKDAAYRLPTDRKCIINVGSVGQPRDRDVRSCYVEFDGRDVRFRRVEYDVEETIRKIHQSGRLHASLGQRLREGK